MLTYTFVQSAVREAACVNKNIQQCSEHSGSTSISENFNLNPEDLPLLSNLAKLIKCEYTKKDKALSFDFANIIIRTFPGAGVSELSIPIIIIPTCKTCLCLPQKKTH